MDTRLISRRSALKSALVTTAGLAAPALVGGARAQGRNELVFVGFGGAYQEGQAKALFELVREGDRRQDRADHRRRDRQAEGAGRIQECRMGHHLPSRPTARARRQRRAAREARLQPFLIPPISSRIPSPSFAAVLSRSPCNSATIRRPLAGARCRRVGSISGTRRIFPAVARSTPIRPIRSSSR